MELSKVTLEIFSKLEHKWLLSHSEPKSRKTRVLCIDGGNGWSMVSGHMLIHLEEQIRVEVGDPEARIADWFDLVAGTGIGGILAAMVVADEGCGRGLFSARDAVAFLERRRSELFKASWFLGGRSMEKVLKEAFRRLTLKDTCKPLLVPCFDLNTSAPFVFSRADACDSPSFDFLLWKVCRATSSTPSLFKPFTLASLDGKTCCCAVDGGLVMNNPAAAAITHVLHNKRDFPSVNGVEDLLLLSIGNGSCSKWKPLRRNGECSTSAVIEIAVDGVSETVDQMLGNAFCWNPNDYVRIQNGAVGPTMKEEEVLQQKAVETVPFGGKRLLRETNGERISNFVQRLVASSSTTSLAPSPCKDSALTPLPNAR